MCGFCACPSQKFAPCTLSESASKPKRSFYNFQSERWAASQSCFCQATPWACSAEDMTYALNESTSRARQADRVTRGNNLLKDWGAPSGLARFCLRRGGVFVFTGVQLPTISLRTLAQRAIFSHLVCNSAQRNTSTTSKSMRILVESFFRQLQAYRFKPLCGRLAWVNYTSENHKAWSRFGL